jgi:uncharacterized protein HemX
METQINTPKWQAKFERSFPSEIIDIVNDVPKPETPRSGAKTEGLNPWLVVGTLTVLGIVFYIIWKQDQDAKKKNSKVQLHNQLPRC